MNQDRIKRCINLDWLEVYALEPPTEPAHNADYFRVAGWVVREREYGTPVYHEMFTLYGSDDLPLIEVRRNPKSKIGEQVGGVLDPYATHIRLCNRTCYFENAAEIMEEFLARYHYTMKRISRLDICLDFERFDSGDEPQKFLNRYINGKYSKINQSEIALHGLDCWDGRQWNSVKWGSHKSMITTKMYDKTLELRQVHDKPYIRQAWYEAGLISDWYTMEKHTDNGDIYKPRIWRVEFSIKSHENNWFVVENPYNTKPRLRSIRHTLDMYKTKLQMCDVYFSLCEHYFHFKYVEYMTDDKTSADRQLKRKDRCKDKMLFNTKTISTFYKVANVNTSEKTTKEDTRLLKMLHQYQEHTIEPQVNKAINVIIEHIEKHARRSEIVGEVDEKTTKIIQLLVQRRMHGAKRSLEDDLHTIMHYLDNEPSLFA